MISWFETKAVRRFPGWARNYWQTNHQILKAFFTCERGWAASLAAMRAAFLRMNPDRNAHQFRINLRSMSTEDGNSHGLVFVVEGDRVTMAEYIRGIASELRDRFL